MIVALESIIVARHADQKCMQLLFSAIAGHKQEIRQRLLAEFLKHNTNVGDFTSLKLDSDTLSASGSFVPAWTKRKEYYESLLPLLSHIDLLEHREVIESTIRRFEAIIEKQKRDDFLRD
jgi:hypothetical protein